MQASRFSGLAQILEMQLFWDCAFFDFEISIQRQTFFGSYVQSSYVYFRDLLRLTNAWILDRDFIYFYSLDNFYFWAQHRFQELVFSVFFLNFEISISYYNSFSGLAFTFFRDYGMRFLIQRLAFSDRFFFWIYVQLRLFSGLMETFFFVRHFGN